MRDSKIMMLAAAPEGGGREDTTIIAGACPQMPEKNE
jgi:hypothetical protein